MEAHGFEAWLDERQLRPGAALNPMIRAHIRASDVLLVIASSASAASNWVGLEIQFAIEALVAAVG